MKKMVHFTVKVFCDIMYNSFDGTCFFFWNGGCVELYPIFSVGLSGLLQMDKKHLCNLQEGIFIYTYYLDTHI